MIHFIPLSIPLPRSFHSLIYSITKVYYNKRISQQIQINITNICYKPWFAVLSAPF
ncbi:hypothetical protein Hanom_Chr12g01096801 [Helianthus anomalus]